MATVERGRQEIDRGVEKAQAKANAGRGWYAVVARAGLVAKGVSYGLVGLLAGRLAIGAGGSATSRQGALHELARQPFGKVMLVALAVGLAAYALWRFVQALAERSDADEGTLKTWGKRIGYVGRGLIYAGLTYSSVKILTGASNGGSQDAKAHHSTATVLGWPAGRFIVGAAGLCVVGIALWNLYRGLSRKFEDKWRISRLGHGVRTWGTRVGVVGHVARFVVFGLIGVFLTKAAVDYNPQDAIGLDGALQKLAHASYGPYLLGLTAAGLIAYGLYCFVDAALRDVSANA